MKKLAVQLQAVATTVAAMVRVEEGTRAVQGSKNTDGQQSGGATAATGGPQSRPTGGGSDPRGGYQLPKGAGGGSKKGGGSKETDHDMPAHMK